MRPVWRDSQGQFIGDVCFLYVMMRITLSVAKIERTSA